MSRLTEKQKFFFWVIVFIVLFAFSFTLHGWGWFITCVAVGVLCGNRGAMAYRRWRHWYGN